MRVGVCFGLLVAVPAAWSYNYFASHMEQLLDGCVRSEARGIQECLVFHFLRS
jgi:biopolymer transport protein ExbB/TolQ